MFSRCFLTIFNFSYSRFGFEGGILVLIAPVSGRCMLVTLFCSDMCLRFMSICIYKRCFVFVFPGNVLTINDVCFLQTVASCLIENVPVNYEYFTNHSFLFVRKRLRALRRVFGLP